MSPACQAESPHHSHGGERQARWTGSLSWCGSRVGRRPGKDFYTEKAGFIAEHDHRVSDEMRFVQVTPPGSACSITFGNRYHGHGPRSVQGLQLVVPDIEAARNELLERGVEVGDVQVFPWARSCSSATPTATAGPSSRCRPASKVPQCIARAYPVVSSGLLSGGMPAVDGAATHPFGIEQDMTDLEGARRSSGRQPATPRKRLTCRASSVAAGPSTAVSPATSTSPSRAIGIAIGALQGRRLLRPWRSARPRVPEGPRHAPPAA